MKKKLTKTDEATLQKASRSEIEDAFSELKRHLGDSQWLAAGNKYRRNTIESLKRDTEIGHSLDIRDLTQYVAASAPLHCTDGWALLGRAIDCHSRRDHDSARHFAYYAELRAALSILAAEGIGIFNLNHFVVQPHRQCAKLEGPTHKIAWWALEHWAELKRATDLLGSSIQIDGIPLQEWLDHFPPSASLQPVGSEWLRTWGLDLRLISDDRESRNEASYRPTGLNQRPTLGLKESGEFICALWWLCEPSSQSRFGGLDKHLLRLALEGVFRGVRDVAPAAAKAQFRDDIQKMLAEVVPDSATRRRWLDFLTRLVEPEDPAVLSEAKRDDPVDSPRRHLQMISRAALLLRTATAASSRLLHQCDISTEDVRFWWSSLGQDRGLWERTKEPNDLRDLWADAKEAVDGVQEWIAKNGGSPDAFMHWRRERSYEISVLGSCERIALWGLGL